MQIYHPIVGETQTGESLEFIVFSQPTMIRLRNSLHCNRKSKKVSWGWNPMPQRSLYFAKKQIHLKEKTKIKAISALQKETEEVLPGASTLRLMYLQSQR